MDRTQGALVAATVLCVASIFAGFSTVWGLAIGHLGAGVTAIGAGVGTAVVSLLKSSLAERD